MKRAVFIAWIICLTFVFSGCYAKEENAKFILLVSEQNIASIQRAWWVTEIDLSSAEATIAKNLIAAGFEVMEPSDLKKVITKDKALRRIDISEKESVKLGNLSKADYVILGKAIASKGANVPQSNMVSCFANITVKLIRVKDGKVVAYLDAAGSSAHLDAVTGGSEALSNAAGELAAKVINVLNEQ